jgi:hypothetical protein
LKKPHVVILNEFFYPDQDGGTASAVANLAEQLVRSGDFRVSVITSRNSYRDSNAVYAEYEKWSGMEIHRVSAPNWSRQSLKKRFLGNLAYTHGAYRKLKELEPTDLVIVTSAPIPQPAAALLFKRSSRVPYLYVVYDLDPDRTVALGVRGENSIDIRMLKSWQRKWLKARIASSP